MVDLDFKTWILHFKNVDRPIGDLATDIARDNEFPTENSKEVIRNYLKRKSSFSIVSAVLETFDNAWDYYLKDNQ